MPDLRDLSSSSDPSLKSSSPKASLPTKQNQTKFRLGTFLLHLHKKTTDKQDKPTRNKAQT